MTLNAGKYWNDTTVTNTMKSTIKNYWTSYTANNNTGTLNINVGQQTRQGNSWVYKDKNYALTHPNTGYDVDPADGYDYVDNYYDADNAMAVANVFQNIIDEIAISAPTVPTDIKEDTDPTNGGDSVIFRYQMSEIIPQTPVNGMTYDNSVYMIDVNVSADPSSDTLTVTPVYSNGESSVTLLWNPQHLKN